MLSRGQENTPELDGTLLRWGASRNLHAFECRDGVPQHRVVVMNRTSRSNFVFDVVSTLQLKLVKPYLMLKDSANDEAGVNGIWFQDEAERKAVTQALARLLRGSGGAAPAPAAAGDPLEKVAAPSGVVAGRTLLSMVQASPAAGASASLPQVPLPVSGSGMPAPASAAAPRLAPAAGLAPAAAALFSSFAASQREQQQRAAAVAAAPSAAVVAAPAPDVPPAPSTPSMLLTRAQLRDALLELLGDDSFVADLHSRYLTTAARQAGSGR